MAEGIVHGMSDAEYHSRPELSSTEARMLLQSPSKYRWRKDNPPLIDDSPKFDIGKAVHARVLGVGADVVVVDADDWRTKAAREAREEARAAGKAPLLTHEFEAVNAMTESVLAHATARALLSQPGDSEVSLFAEVEGVPVRARFDFLPEQGEKRVIAVDLKTTVDASFRKFERSIADYRYDIQEQWYMSALEALTGPMPHGFEPEMLFVAVEKTPPYDVAVHAITPEWKTLARDAAARARRLYAECVASGVWPGYPQEIQYHAPPTWLVIQAEEDAGEMEVA